MTDKNSSNNFDEEFDFPLDEEFDEGALQATRPQKANQKLLRSLLGLAACASLGFYGFQWAGTHGVNLKNLAHDKLDQVLDNHKALGSELAKHSPALIPAAARITPAANAPQLSPDLALTKPLLPNQAPTSSAPIMPSAVVTTPTTPGSAPISQVAAPPIAEPQPMTASVSPATPIKVAAENLAIDPIAPSPTPKAPEQSLAVTASLATAQTAPLNDIKELFEEHQELSRSITPMDVKKTPMTQLPSQAASKTESPAANNGSPLQEDLQLLVQNLKSLANKIEHIDRNLAQQGAQLVDISRALQNVNSNVNAIDSRVLGLSSTVGALSSDLSNVKRALNEDTLDMPPLPNMAKATSGAPSGALAAPSPATPITYQAPEFVVHAIIPGRAWLKSTKGQILTVTEGEVLGDYGKVLMIDVNNGTVLTSSGLSFR